jgi:sialidase-1
LDVPATRPTTAPSPAGRLLFAHPADEHGRTHGTIYVSDDDGKTWPTPLQLVTGKFAYCCLAVLPDGSVGCLYEAEDYRRIELLKVTMNRTGGLTASAP